MRQRDVVLAAAGVADNTGGGVGGVARAERHDQGDRALGYFGAAWNGMAQSRAAAAATPVRNIRDRFLFMKLLLKKVWMDQTASRLHPLYSSQMV